MGEVPDNLPLADQLNLLTVAPNADGKRLGSVLAAISGLLGRPHPKNTSAESASCQLGSLPELSHGLVTVMEKSAALEPSEAARIFSGSAGALARLLERAPRLMMTGLAEKLFPDIIRQRVETVRAAGGNIRGPMDLWNFLNDYPERALVAGLGDRAAALMKRQDCPPQHNWLDLVEKIVKARRSGAAPLPSDYKPYRPISCEIPAVSPESRPGRRYTAEAWQRQAVFYANQEALFESAALALAKARQQGNLMTVLAVAEDLNQQFVVPLELQRLRQYLRIPQKPANELLLRELVLVAAGEDFQVNGQNAKLRTKARLMAFSLCGDLLAVCPPLRGGAAANQMKSRMPDLVIEFTRKLDCGKPPCTAMQVCKARTWLYKA